ncbi:MHYT domain-containing protein [Oligoflexus tunisiensis]|uniref:MHYT domain-containing protein n=1 Tax=Oligoflexus tunisiensis TaxID=708132 RepID=UPI000A9CC88A|nr:MHYT domain-containing protein [Oligoflexus tunisiensis]
MVMETQFSPLLVTISIIVAIFASYVALNLAHSVVQAQGRARAIWLSCGALAMGVGIWSMHFVGMLAFEMPGMTMAYDLPLMILSVAVAIGASGLAFHMLSQPLVPMGSILSGGITMAAAIAGMHYIGMYSMRMAATIQWNIYLVVLSVVIALLASYGALFILIRLRDKEEKFWKILSASVVMGLAISGMHYTGMYAATFVHKETSTIGSEHLIVTSWLAVVVIVASLVILGLALAGSFAHRLVTRRSRKADEILGKSEEKFRRLVEAVKDYAIFMLDPAGRITTWNSGAQRITGYPEEEVIGKHVSIFYRPEDVANRTAHHELEAARQSQHFEGEGRRVRKDGSIFWASVVIVPLSNPDGTLSGFSSVTRDITQVKESEQNLRQLNEELEQRVRMRTQSLQERENQLRTITNALPVLVAQLDRDERFLFANEAFCKWFNHKGHEPVNGKTLHDIFDDARYKRNEPFIRNVLSGAVTTYEKESTSGTTTATLAITLVPEFDSEHKVSGFIVVASDITRHKEIQAELEKAKEAAEVANATKSSFLANMSHEIRTPLGAVLGFSELLITEELTSPERSNYMEIIRRNGQLLSNIINDILDLSKVEAGKLEVERSDVPLSDILKELASILSLEAAAKGIELKVTSEGVMPQQIRTDALRLRQILLNIVGNAIKFTQRGSVTVRVKLQPYADDTMKLVFVVTDTGEGISPEKMERIFAPFSQADVSTTRKFGGTGLGLALSKKLANILGGDVILSRSAPGQGSTFVVTIDPGISETVLFQSSDQMVNNVIPLAKPAEEVNLSRLKILVVDDSTDNQALIKRILKVLGASVTTANNGREGVERALSDNFNLVLMDIQMPEMDGYEAVRTLRDHGYKKPIIALTAHAMKEEHNRSLQSGFDDHITKPIDRKLLVRTLSKYPH